MAKSRNHTAHNQTYKAHRNGIHKPAKNKYSKMRGMDQKFLRNRRYALKNNKIGQKRHDRLAKKKMDTAK